MCSGVIRTFRRCSSGLPPRILVLAEVLLRELVDLRVRAVGRHLGAGRRPRPTCRSRSGRRRAAPARGSFSRCFGFARPVAVLNESDAVLDVDPDDRRVRRAVLAQRRRDARRRAAPGTPSASRSASPSRSPSLRVSQKAKQSGPGCRSLVTCGSSSPSRRCSSAASASSCTSASRRSRTIWAQVATRARRPARPRALPELRGQSRRRERGGGQRPVRRVGNPVGHDRPQAPDLLGARALPARRATARVRCVLHERGLPAEDLGGRARRAHARARGLAPARHR